MLSRQRQPGRQGVTARWAVVITLFGLSVACTTPSDLTTADGDPAERASADRPAPDRPAPERPAPAIPNSPWKTETFITANPAVPVTVAILDPAPAPEQVWLVPRGGRGAGSDRRFRGLSVGTTPWRRSLTGRQPVGVVIESGQVRSAPVPPYWAVVLSAEGEWHMVAQRELSDISRTTGGAAVQGEIDLAVGGFYPLIARGQVVAGEFPGRTIRAPRVAMGGTAGDDPRLVIVATGSADGAGDSADPKTRGGLTTVELARLLHRYELDWALNLDGGRSAYFRFAAGSVWPPGVWLRRPGPVVLRIEPSQRSPAPPEVVE